MLEPIDARILRTRSQVIDKAIEMIDATRSRLFGQGEDLDWIEDPGRGEQFACVLSEALRMRNVTLELIAYGRGSRAFRVAKKLTEVRPSQVEILFKKQGHARVLVSDDLRILLAFRRQRAGRGRGISDYIGLYLENRQLANWLAERHMRLRNSVDARALDDQFHALMWYHSELRTFELLADREATILKTIELISNATDSLRIAGQSIDWIGEEPELGDQLAHAIRDAKRNRVSCLRALAARSTRIARCCAREWRDLEVEVRLNKDYGQARYVVVDSRHIVIALPMEPKPRERRDSRSKMEYIAVCATDPKLARWLEQRFDYLWDNGTDFGLPLLKKLKKLRNLGRFAKKEIGPRLSEVFLSLVLFAMGYLASELLKDHVRSLLDQLFSP